MAVGRISDGVIRRHALRAGVSVQEMRGYLHGYFGEVIDSASADGVSSCGDCGGEGLVRKIRVELCPTCKGSGKQTGEIQ